MEKRVILVDSNKSTQELIKQTLSLKGIQVESINDGLSGVDISLEKKPDMLFITSDMEGIEPLDFCKLLKKYDDRNIPIVLIMNGKEVNYEQLQEHGVVESISKPLKAETVLNVTGRYLTLDDSDDDDLFKPDIISAIEEAGIEEEPTDKDSMVDFSGFDIDTEHEDKVFAALSDTENEEDEEPAVDIGPLLGWPEPAETQPEEPDSSEPTTTTDETDDTETQGSEPAWDASQDDTDDAGQPVIELEENADQVHDEPQSETSESSQEEQSCNLGDTASTLNETDETTDEIEVETPEPVIESYEPTEETPHDSKLFQSIDLDSGESPDEAIATFEATTNSDEVDETEASATTETTAEITAETTADKEELTEAVRITIDEVVKKIAPDIIERIAWEIIPDLAEVIIKEEIKRLEDEKSN